MEYTFQSGDEFKIKPIKTRLRDVCTLIRNLLSIKFLGLTYIILTIELIKSVNVEDVLINCIGSIIN